MRADSRTRSRVGVIVFASLLLFAVMVVVVGGKTGFFLARSGYFARFPNSQGLMAGNQVRLAGVTVGTVQQVEVPKEPGQDLTVRFDIVWKNTPKSGRVEVAHGRLGRGMRWVAPCRTER